MSQAEPRSGKPCVASHADVLRGSSRVPAPRTPRGAGTRDETLGTSVWEPNHAAAL